MPVITNIDYNPPLLFKYHHFATIIPSLTRRVKSVNYRRERWETPDGDFLDVDWSESGNKKLVIALHGLEGSSDSSYIKGIVRIFNQNDYDALAMNFRGCSGSPNLLRRGYHSGETEDLDFVLKTVLAKEDYEEIVLVGFSMGGNVVLKYGGERGENIHPKIKKIIGVSVPVDLAGCCNEIEKRHNFIYLNRFLVSLKKKFKLRQMLYEDIDPQKVFNAKTFVEFDGALTAPVHGFSSAQDYYEKSASQQFLEHLKVPTLLINAKDDSFLSASCYPFQEAEFNPDLYFMAPRYGGHVGFPQFHEQGYYWTEERIMEFVLERGGFI